MPIKNKKVKLLYDTMYADGQYNGSEDDFDSWFHASGDQGYQNRKQVWQHFHDNGDDVGNTYEEFRDRIGLRAVPRKGGTSPAPSSAQSKGGVLGQLSSKVKQRLEQTRRDAGVSEPTPKTGRYTPTWQEEAAFGDMKQSVENTISRARKQTERDIQAAQESMGNFRQPDMNRALDDAIVERERERIENPDAARLREAYEERDRIEARYRERMAEIEKEQSSRPWWQRAILENGRADAGAIVTDYDTDPELVALRAASRKNKETITMMEDARSGKTNSFWHTLGTELTNGRTLSLGGLAGMEDVAAVQQAAKHVDAINRKRATGEELTRDEQTAETVLENFALQKFTENELGNQYGKWARAGKTTAGSLGFMMDFLMTPGAGTLAKGVFKGVVKGGTRLLGKNASNLFAKYMLKTTGATIGSMAAGGMISNTIGIGRTMSDAGGRMQGDVYLDNDGNYVFGHYEDDGKGGARFVEGGDTALDAIFAAERSAIAENGSEMLGEFLPGSKFILKGMEKVGLSKLASSLKTVGGKGWYQTYSNMLEKIGFHGTPGEILEEYGGMGLDAIMGGDEWKSLADKRTHIDIILGCVTTGALLNAPHIAGSGAEMAQYYRYKHKTNVADRTASERMGEDVWSALRERIDGADNESITDVTFDIIDDNNLTNDQRIAVMDYVTNLQRMRGYSLGRMMQRNDETSEDAEGLNQSFVEGYGITDEAEGNKLKKQVDDLRSELMAGSDWERIKGRIDSDPMSLLAEMRENPSEWTDETQNTVTEYINAQMSYDGMQQRKQDDAEIEHTAKTEHLRGFAQREDLGGDGMLHPAVLRGDGRKVYIVSGNVEMLPDGGVNTQVSDKDILVRDEETGEIRWTTADNIDSLEEVSSVEDAVTAVEIVENAEKAAQQVEVEEETTETAPATTTTPESTTTTEEETPSEPSESTVVADSTPTETSAQAMPKRMENGREKPDWDKVTPQRAHDYIYNEKGLTSDEADAFVSTMSARAKSDLDAKLKEAPDMVDDIDDYLERKASWQKEVDALRRKKEYWDGVRQAAEASRTAAPATTSEKVATAEAETNTSPTDAQKKAGNYKKGHVKIDGYDITIENPKGSERSGKDANGNPWSVTMNNTYGYIRGTAGKDGDHIDVFLSDDLDGWNGQVFVIDQVKEDGTFDEHKVMYGFNTEEEARAAYLSNYSPGWKGLGNITAVSKEDFQKWTNSSHRKMKPFAEYKSVKPVQPILTDEQKQKLTDEADYLEGDIWGKKTVAERAKSPAVKARLEQEIANAQARLDEINKLLGREVKVEAENAEAGNDGKNVNAEAIVAETPVAETPAITPTETTATETPVAEAETPAAETKSETPSEKKRTWSEREERRRKPIRRKLRDLSKRLGVNVTIHESVDDIDTPEVAQAIDEGYEVHAWFSEKEDGIHFYLPHIEDENFAERKFFHEGVVHYGLRKMMGDSFDEFLDMVWESMSDAQRKQWLGYKGVEHLTGDIKRRAAMEEYIAFMSEDVNMDKGFWDKVVAFIREKLGLHSLTEADIRNAIRESYKRLQEAADTVSSGGIDFAGQSKPTHFSTSSIMDGAGVELMRDERGKPVPMVDNDGNVIIRINGKEYSGKSKDTLVTADVLKNKKNKNCALNMMVEDALAAKTITKKKADVIYKKYADILNSYLLAGTKERGGADSIQDSWRWLGETIYRTVATNGDAQYGWSLDITRVCKKNEAVIKTISELQVMLGYGITPAQIMDIYTKTLEGGYQVPCPVCYVFSRYIRNGKYATAAIRCMEEWGEHLPGGNDVWTAEQWGEAYKEAAIWNEENAKLIEKANEDLVRIPDKIDTLSRRLMNDKRLTEKEKASIRQEIEDLDARYRAALNVNAHMSKTNWIKTHVLKVSSGGQAEDAVDNTYTGTEAAESGKKVSEKDKVYTFEFREGGAMEKPSDMDEYRRCALDLRLTGYTMEKYPAIQRLRKSGCAAAGKEITFASNNELGEIVSGVGINEPSKSENFYKEAADAYRRGDKEAADKLRAKATQRFNAAVMYAARQSLRGGQRMWSWSDNIENLSPDIAVNLMQLELLGGALQTYTKQLEGANMVSSMKGYTNGSLMAKDNGWRQVDADNIEVVDGKKVLKSDITETITEQTTEGARERKRILAEKGSPVYTDSEGDFVLIFDDVIGIDPHGIGGKTGLFGLNDKISRCGNIIVGMNDRHIKIALADRRIFFCIPWHSSGANQHTLAQMFDLLGTRMKDFVSTDYTAMQEEKNMGKTKDGSYRKIHQDIVDLWEEIRSMADFACGIEGGVESGKEVMMGGKRTYRISDTQMKYRKLREAIFDGTIDDPANAKMKEQVLADEFLSQVYNTVHDRIPAETLKGSDGKEYEAHRMTAGDNEFIYPYEYWDTSSTYENAGVNNARYLEYCRRLGYRPKFSGKWDRSGKRDKTSGDFTTEDGYWKLLIDRRMYGVDGNYQDLTPIDSEGFEPDMIDSVKNHDKFHITEAADDEGVTQIAKATYEMEENRTSGGVPRVDYAIEGDAAVSEYAKQRKKTASVKFPVRGAEEEGGVRFSVSSEIAKKYPNWMDNQVIDDEKSKKGQRTQVTNTVGTYKKVGKWISDNLGKDKTILDASSGLGLGTIALREDGFNVEDIEPYPGKGRTEPPTYGGVDAYQRAMDDGKEYDYIISNAVLNVIPDDWRSGVLHDMAQLLRPGGQMFINTRQLDNVHRIKNKIELENEYEVLVGTPDNITSYQKFFSPAELKEYVEKELGGDYTVEVANKSNSGTNGLAAVVVTKSPDAGKVRFSVTSKEEDKAYIDAVEKGDEEAAADMVKMAVKRAMPNTMVVDENGDPKVVYHGTIDQFDVFDIDETEFGAFHFSSTEEGAKEAIMNKIYERWMLNPDNASDVKEAERIFKERARIIPAYLNIENLLHVSDSMANDIAMGRRDGDKSANSGYAYTNDVEDEGTDSYMVFNSNQIKSADTITRDDAGKVIPLSERFNNEKKDIRFSISPKENKAYMDAVEKGDKKTARRMVIEVARKAMPDTKAVDRDGNPIVLYRGGEQYNQFDRSKADEYAMYGRAYYATTSLGEAENFAETRTGSKENVQKVFLNTKNPFVEESVEELGYPEETSIEQVEKLCRLLSDKGFVDAMDLYNRYKNGKVKSIIGALSDSKVEGKERKEFGWWGNSEIVQETLREMGYDGVIGKFSGENFRATQVAVFDPEQIKSADPITYDDAGNVIPLSERFNPENEDIRFSVSKKEREQYAKRQWNRAHELAKDWIEKLKIGDVATVYDSVDDIPEGVKVYADKKGWYDEDAKKITIVMNNHNSPQDVLHTILREAVARHGMRELFGSHYDTFLDNVYNNAIPWIQDRIDEKGKDTRTATEEYLAELAENTDFERGTIASDGNTKLVHWFHSVKEAFLEMLNKLGLKGIYTSVSFTDNELRYMLWRSYKNLTEPGVRKNPWQVAEDIVQRQRLQVGDFAKVEEPSERAAAEPRDIRFSIRGEKGAANDKVAMDNLDVAKEMEKDGKDTRTIWLATGWEKGKDGKWRNEIPDAKPKPFSATEKMTLTDIVDAPELFAAYPDLKEYKVEIKKLKDDLGIFYHGRKLFELDIDGNTTAVEVPDDVRKKIEEEVRDWFWSNKGVTNRQAQNYLKKRLEEVGQRVLNDNGIKSILHELQHAIQGIEGFARGGSPEEGQKRYRSLAGEVEARNVARRNSLSDKAKQNTPLSSTEDVSREDQLVRFSVSPKEDKAYMDAVNKGDMETARRMVIEAARKAMPNTLLVDEDGNPIVMFHGSDAKHNKFNMNDGAMGKGAYFTSVFEEAADYVRAALGREDMSDDDIDNGQYITEAFLDIRDKKNIAHSQYGDGILGLATSPNQIKSAEPVTYDDAGNVIPLSERFNPEKEDIRFSIRGEKGAANDKVAMDNLDVAKEMEEKGKDAKAIWLATGWEKGKDGKWRNEIPDAKPKVDIEPTASNKLSDIIDAPELFAAYPELKDYKVLFEKLDDAGYADVDGKTIHLDLTYNVDFKTPEEDREKVQQLIDNYFAKKRPSKRSLLNYIQKLRMQYGKRMLSDEGLRTLLHEIQHVIQGKEGFAQGSSVNTEGNDALIEQGYLPEMMTYYEALCQKNTLDTLLKAGRRTALRILRNDRDNNRWHPSRKADGIALIERLENMTDLEYRQFATIAKGIGRKKSKYGLDRYKRQAGEVEARNVEVRNGYSVEERREFPPSETEDVPRDKQLVRFSITPKEEKEYKEAVESEDKKKVKDLIIQAAEAAMPNLKVRDKNGNLKVFYHGTVAEEPFNVFGTDLIFTISKEGLAQQYTHKRRSLSIDPRTSGRVMPVFVNLENPLVIDAKRRQWYNIKVDWRNTPASTVDIAAYALKKGYDGVIINNVRDNIFSDDPSVGDVAIAFDSSQLKSTGPSYEQVRKWHFPWDTFDVLSDVFGPTYDDNGNLIPLSERFDPEKKDIRFSISPKSEDEIFVSNARKAVEGIKQEKAKPDQWLAMIQKAGGLKAGEDKWIGLSDWLKSKGKDTVTKEEVMDYIRQNQVQVEEVHYADELVRVEEAIEKKYPGITSAFEIVVYPDGDVDIDAKDKKAAIELYNKYNEDDQIDPDNYEKYDLATAVEWAYDMYSMTPPSDDVKHTESLRLQYTTDGLNNKREIALVVPTIESWNQSDNVHFGDAGNGKAVAWIRFGETTDAEGNRVLVIDEIQSKRHQEGRERGYKLRVKDMKKLGWRMVKAGNTWSLFNPEGKRRVNAITADTEQEAWDFIDYASPNEGGTIPQAPFEKNWHELAMKRMLRYAAENGFDKIAWTKGEQQAGRYGLGETVMSIDVSDVKEDGSRTVWFTDKEELNPHAIEFDKDGKAKKNFYVAKGTPIADVFGEALGSELMKAKDGDSFEPGDLKRIGGEGMNGFYDQMLPRFMDKYGKKWGVKTGEVDLSHLSDKKLKEAGGKMWSVDVTPAMKESVMKGQTMFSIGAGFTERDRVLARDSYERMVSRGLSQFREAVQDSMLSLKQLYEAVLDAVNTNVKNQGGQDVPSRIEDVPDYENAYLAENRMSSMSSSAQHRYYNRFMKPLLEEIHHLCEDNDGDRDTLTDYMLAKHGLERNLVLAERDAREAEAKGEDYNDAYQKCRERDYAGLTALTGMDDLAAAEAEAQRMVDDYESSHYTNLLWRLVKDATEANLTKLYRSGLMSKETYDKVRGMFEFYVPLRGWDEKTSDEVYGYLTSPTGPMNGGVMKRAEGRKSKADDPIATIAMMADAAIMQGNRNLMKQRFLNFVLNHPSDAVSVSDLWLRYNDISDEWEPVFPDLDPNDTAADVDAKVKAFEQQMQQFADSDPDHYKRSHDAVNVPYKVVNNNLREHQVIVERGGRKYVLTINGNPRAAQALNGLTNPDVEIGGVVGNLIRGGEWLNRQLSSLYTTRNPDFVVSNFMRDLVYSNVMSWVKEGGAWAWRFNTTFFKRVTTRLAYRLFSKWENGTLDHSNYMEHLFHQFMENGGETGYTNVKDLEGHKRTVAAELRRQGSTFRASVHELGEWFDQINRTVENRARFSAFVTSMEMGRGVARSIWDAKEISVNFNKKGSGGKMVNATGQTTFGKVGGYIGDLGKVLYVFWNAGVQGMTNFGRAAYRNPRKAMTMGVSAFLLGALMSSLNKAFGGDDDDKDAYFNLPEKVRRTNIIFPAGKSWISIPLPIELRALYGLGELAGSVGTGAERYDTGELVWNIAGEMSQVVPLDLLEGGGGAQNLLPSMARPFVESYWMNRSWTGMPIYRKNDFNESDPEWTKAYSNANTFLVSMARILNEATGGDDYKKGGIDVNPAQLEYVLSGYFGGLWSVGDKLVKMGETAFGSRDFEWRNMLLANRLVKTGDERTEARKLTNEYFKYKKEYESVKRLDGKYEQASADDSKYAEKLEKLRGSNKYTRYQVFDAFDPILNAVHDAMKGADDKTMEGLKAAEVDLRREMIDLMHDFDDGKVSSVDEVVDETLKSEYNSGGQYTRKAAAKSIAKRLGGTDSYGSPDTDWGKEYERRRSYTDLAEDVLLLVEQNRAKEAGDEAREKTIKAWREAIRKPAQGMEVRGGDADVAARNSEIMERVRELRRMAMENLGIMGTM